MAETVLSMARSLVGSAVSKAASAAAAEMSLLMGVQKEIWFIKDELKTMQAFLIAPEVTKKKDKLVKVWAEQVRELSYDIEDCLDEFMVHVGSKRLSQQLMNLKDRHRIAIQIRNLKSRVEEVSSRNTRYNLIKTEASSTTDETDSYMEDVRNHSASNINEAELVGFSKPKEELLNLIDVHAKNGPARVVCVVGMGGLGKTTIARKIYESKEDIAKNFSCCAWITVSQSFVRMELLKDMIKLLFGDEVLKELEGKAMIEVLASYLREELNEKRYFIVLDDLWSIDAWKWIVSIAFPSNNIKGSRIIVTTRDVGLAEQCTSGSLIYHLKPLQEHDAKDLLLRKTKTNERNEDMENDENMSNIVTKIVKKCGCLPLAILTIGGVLATKKVTEWGNFYKQLPSELESNPGLEAMRRMVTLSYNYLPSHLKPCFLYLSIFPEDFEIERRRLVDRWIAEGFVKARAGMTIEDVGKCYFNELANRSMIQPSQVSIKGAYKTCRVHWKLVKKVLRYLQGTLAFVTGLLGRFQSNPGIEHWKLVKKVLRYLQGTKGLMMTYRRSDSLHIVGYTDSDYAGDDRKSTSGYVFTLAGGAISWKSSKQTVTTSSTMYAEFVACYEATGQVNWLKKFIPGLKVVDDIHKPLKLYCDNEPAVCYAHNNKSSGAVKHIDIKYYVVKDKVRDHIISLEHIRTEKMLADPLTKGLPPNVFGEHLAGMGLRESL